MPAEQTKFSPSNSIFMNLPKREELLLRSVLALPKPSRMGLDCMIFVSSPSCPNLPPANPHEMLSCCRGHRCLPLLAQKADGQPPVGKRCTTGFIP
jgi:hypothetical protein